MATPFLDGLRKELQKVAIGPARFTKMVASDIPGWDFYPKPSYNTATGPLSSFINSEASGAYMSNSRFKDWKSGVPFYRSIKHKSPAEIKNLDQYFKSLPGNIQHGLMGTERHFLPIDPYRLRTMERRVGHGRMSQPELEAWKRKVRKPNPAFMHRDREVLRHELSHHLYDKKHPSYAAKINKPWADRTPRDWRALARHTLRDEYTAYGKGISRMPQTDIRQSAKNLGATPRKLFTPFAKPLYKAQGTLMSSQGIFDNPLYTMITGKPNVTSNRVSSLLNKGSLMSKNLLFKNTGSFLPSLRNRLMGMFRMMRR